MAITARSGKTSIDLVVVGGGVIGLATALLARRSGMSVRVVDAGIAGAASTVAAGLLAPSLGRLEPAAASAFVRARDRYDGFLDLIREASGDNDLRLGRGILEIPEENGAAVNEAGDPDALAMDSAEIARQFPDLAAGPNGVMHSKDGWIDPVRLIAALRKALESEPIADDVIEIETMAGDVRLLTRGQRWIHCDRVVIAAGAWTQMIKGIAKIPIRPAKGEVLVLETTHALEHAVASGGAYIVPRGDSIVVGSTFVLDRDDHVPTVVGQATLMAYANRLIPRAVARARSQTGWAGVRPITPDRLPIIDSDPLDPRITYACGHGKNGLLLAGLTAELVLDLLSGNRLDPASPFRLSRFN
jgi:glycine oxidase